MTGILLAALFSSTTGGVCPIAVEASAWGRRRRGVLLLTLLLPLLALMPDQLKAASVPPSTQAPLAALFDHLSTGFELDGVHRDVPCESCHLNAVFYGTPRDCGSCHATGSQFNGMPKTANHIASTNNCAACHNTMAFRPDAHFDHAEVLGSCVSCHNGTIAQGEGPNHPATSQNCGACHSVMSWNPTRTVDHSQIPLAMSGRCIVCHNGVAASGKPPGHVVTNQECGLCHSMSSWLGAGGLPAGHMPNPGNQACNTCHTAAPNDYSVMASIAVLHTGINGNCAQCHGATQLTFYNNNDNPKAAVLTPAHIPLLAGKDCSACHAASYVAGGFGPMNMTQATHASVSTTCKTCHETGLSFYMGAANPKLQGRPADHTSATMKAPNDCGGCHTTANWNSNAMPAGHMPNPGNQACNTCHTAAPSNYATLASNAVLHTGISSGCGQCHGGMTALSWYNNFTPKDAVLTPAHIPYLSGNDCGSCHSSSTYAAGTFGPMNMTQAKHAFVAKTCNACHEAGLSFYMGAANPGLQGRPADHTSATMKAPNDCGGCHTTANWNSNAMPAGHMPNPGNQACNTCHTAAPHDYSVMASIAVLHTGINGNCAQCHGATQLTFYNNNDNPKAAVLTPAHIPLLAGRDCSACHAANYVTGGFGPMNMTQATHASVSTTCKTCHETGLSFYMGAANPKLQGRPADHTSATMKAPNDCGGCHTTANWNSNTMPAGHMPNPANQACNTCHTAAPNNYTTLASNPVLHTGISGSCNTCHGSPAGPLTFYNNFTPRSAALSPVHIPTGATPCEDCHSRTTFTSFSGTTMNSSEHTQMFAFIGSTCDKCHDLVSPPLNFYGVNNLTTRPGTGHYAGQDCGSGGCHNTSNWDGGAQKRPGATNAKAVAQAKIGPALLPRKLGPRLDPAAMAEATAGAAGVTAAFTHVGLSTACNSCHNGVAAAGKGASHIPSNDNCGNCHTTNAWVPARFDHQGIVARCISCHNGVVTAGRSIRHIPTTLDCSNCHGTIAWRPARFAHIAVAGTCQRCHNALTGIGKSIGHPATSLDCEACHSTLSWTPATSPVTPRPAAAGKVGPLNGPAR